MLDPKRLRSELDEIATQLARRGFKLDVDTISSVEERRKALQIETQNLQNERNSRSKAIGQAKAKGEGIGTCSCRPAMMATITWKIPSNSKAQA